MGIKGLMSLIRTKYPETIIAFPERWASPALRGKRIALDGSLLTNRFFFANDKDDDLASKRVVIGWHALITKLHRFQVKPVVVYDERGLRAWKAIETNRRVGQRALNLARSIHEEQRLERHTRLQELLHRMGKLPDAERVRVVEAVRSIERQGPEALARDAPDVVLATAFLELRDALRTSSRPYARKKAGEFVPLVDSDSEADTDLASADLADASERVIDDPIPPSLDYTETPRQTALTAEEEILQQQLLAVVADSPASSEDLLDLRRSLDDLEVRAKAVAATHERSLDTPSEDDHLEVRELLHVLGVPIVEAPVPYEAEGVASALVHAGLADWVGTEDSDVLAYESKLLRNVTDSAKPLLGIDGAHVREQMQLDREQYIDLMTLAGNDAIPRLHKVGPITALKLLRAHGSIEGILAADEAVAARAGKGYMDHVGISRQMFARLPPFPEALDLDGRKVDEDTIAAFLEERHGLVVAKLEELADNGDTTEQVLRDRGSVDEGAAVSESGAPPELDEATILRELQSRPLE